MNKEIGLLLRSLRNIASHLNTPESIDKINYFLLENFDCLVNKKMKVSLCGKFNAGKSALINAILGEKVVISRPISSTGVITKIYYSSNKFYGLVSRGNSSGNMEMFSEDDLFQKTVKDNFHNSLNVKDIERVDIGLPNDFLSANIELYDTPGLEDSDNNMNEITLNHLNKSDFIIFVIDSMQLKDLKDVLMKYYNRLGKNVLFVANKIDCLDDVELKDIKDLAKIYYSDYYNPITYNSEIFFVSTKEEDLHMVELRTFCKDVLFEKANKITFISRLSIIKFEIKNIYDELKVKIEELSDQLKNAKDASIRNELIKKRKLKIEDKHLLSDFLLKITDQLNKKQLL